MSHHDNARSNPLQYMQECNAQAGHRNKDPSPPRGGLKPSGRRQKDLGGEAPGRKRRGDRPEYHRPAALSPPQGAKDLGIKAQDLVSSWGIPYFS